MNWGKGITLFMITFMLFIGSMVIYAFTKNADLVQEDYYENELAYDHNKESKSNYAGLDDSILVSKKQEGIVFEFPASLTKTMSGKISFYRPDQKKLDREFVLEINNEHQQVLEYKNFKEGYYDLKVEWNSGTKNYLFEDHLIF